MIQDKSTLCKLRFHAKWLSHLFNRSNKLISGVVATMLLPCIFIYSVKAQSSWTVQTTATPPQGSQFNCQTLYVSYGASNIVGLVNDASGGPSLTNPVGRFVATIGAPNTAPADGFSYWVGSLAIGIDPSSGQPAAFGTTWGHGGQSNRPIYKLVNGAATITDSIYNGLKRTTPDLDPWGGLSFNSVDGKLYGVVNNSQQQSADYVVFRMDLKTGVVEKQSISLPGATNALQSLVPDMFFDQAGAGYLGAKTNADPGNNSWTMYRVDFTKTTWVGEPFINFTGLNSFFFYGAAYLNGNIYLGYSDGAIYRIPFQRNLQGINLTTASPRIANYTTGIETPPNMSPSVDGFAVSDLGSCALAPVPPVQPKFACTSTIGYLIQDTVANAYEVNIATGAYTLAKAGLINDVVNRQINGVGYNLKDNYLWGQRPNTNQVVRIGSDWSTELITIPGLPAGSYLYIGDISQDGVLYLCGAPGRSQMFRVDVNPASATYLQLLPILAMTYSNITDWAFSPIDGNLYAISNDDGGADAFKLFRFNPATGARTDLGKVSGGGIQVSGNITFGAAYMDNAGAFYVSANETGNIYKIASPHTGGIISTFVAKGPLSTNNDGARCPLTPIVLNAPSAINDTAVTDINTPVQVNVPANDIARDFPINTGSVVITTPPQHGTVTVGAGGVLQYTPTNGYAGTDSLKYTIADTTSAISNVATVYITINPAKPVDVAIVKSGPATVLPNGALSYKLYITNAGPVNTDNVVVTDSAAANFTATGVTCAAGSGTGGNAGCPVTLSVADLQGAGLIIPTLPAGSSVELTVTGTAGNTGTISNSAAVSVAGGVTDSIPGNNRSTAVTVISPACTGMQTVYLLDPQATLAAAGAIGANGGTVNLVYSLSSGTAIPGIGNSFTVPVQYSDFNQRFAGSNHTWGNYHAYTPYAWDGVNSTPAFGIVPNHASQFAALPANNTTQEATTSPNITDVFFTTYLANNTLTPLGTFNITIGALPAPPAGVRLVSDTIRILSSNNLSTNGNGNNQGGFWVKPIAQTGVHTFNNTAQTDPLVVAYGNTYTYKYSSFSDGTTPTGADRGVVIDYGKVVFCTPLDPVAKNDTANTDVNKPVQIDILANDSAPGAPINKDSTAITLQPQHGTVTVDTSGKITYTPATGYTGTDSLKYTVKDTAGAVSNIATVYITINPLQPPFACTAVLGYLVQDAVASAYEVNLATGVSTLVKSGLISDSVNRGINAIGYNVKDNYIWGQRGNTNQLVRIGNDWSTRLFPITGLAANASMYIGDVSSDGILFMYSGTANIIYRVDVNPASPTYLQLLPNLTTTTSNIFDWAFSPIDGNLYSITAGGGTGDAAFQLLRFNPSTGARTIVGAVAGGGIQVDNPNAQFGAVYMDDEGSLFVSANTSGKIYRIRNPHTGGLVAEFMANGPSSTGNDGARCPLSSIAGMPPKAINDTATTVVNIPVLIDILANDSAISSPLNRDSIAITTQPQHGTISVDTSGKVTYTPAAGYIGKDSLKYTVKDTSGLVSNVATVYITIDPPPQPVFSCTNALGYLFQNDPTDAYVVNLATGTSTLGKNDLLGTTNAGMNALGYNMKDNYLWASHSGTNEIVRIGSDWSVRKYPIAGIPVDNRSNIGDVNSSGVMYWYTTLTTTIYRINLDPASATYLQLLPSLTTTATNISDWAFSPIDGNLYGLNNNNNDPANAFTLYRFNPATGARTILGKVAGGGIQAAANLAFGAAYMDNDGNLYVSNNETGNIYRIASPHTGGITATLVANGPLSGNNDGARCPSTPIVNPPVAANDTASTLVNVPVVIDILANDSAAASPLNNDSVAIITPPQHGTITVDTDGKVTYTPTPGYTGTDSLTYTVKDTAGVTSNVATVVITVTAPIVPPVAVNDSTSTPLNTPVTIPVLSNDSAKTSPIDTAGVVITQQPKHGTAVVNPDGTVTYTPANNYAGLDTLLYTVKDTTGLVSNPATVVIKTPGVAPSPLDDAGTTPVNTPVTIRVLNNDGGPLDSSTVTIVTPPTHGTVVVNPDGTVTYTPNPGYTGPDTLTYTVKSPDGTTSVPVKVIITVTPAPVPPVAVNDSTSTPLNTPVTIPVLSNDSAKTYPIAPATAVITQQPKHGTAVVNPDGTVTYTPVNNYAGLDTLLYTVKDTTGLVSNPATVVIKTPGVAPSPLDDAGTTPVNTPVTIPVLNNDGGPLDSSTVTIVTPPTHGTPVVNPDGTVTYTPNPGYSGPDTLTYTVKSPDGTTSVPVKVIITVTPAPVPPVAVNDSTSTPLNTPVTIPVLSNDSAKTYPIAPATVVIRQQPKHGTVTVNPDGTVTYTPVNNYAGLDTLLYTVKDTTGLVSNPATVVIKTPGVAPSPLDDAGTTPVNTPVTIPVLNNDGGPLDSSTVTIVTPPTHGTPVVNPDGTVTYTPNPGYSGPDTLTYTVKSPDGTTSVPVKVIITVTPAPVPPVAVNDSTSTPLNTPVTIPVLSNDSAKTYPIAPATVVITQQPKHGTVTVNPDGTVTYTPVNNYAGLDTLLYTVKDTAGLVSNPATVVIKTPGVAPSPLDDAGTTPVNTPVTIPVLNNDGGPLDSTTVTIVTPPTHGTVVVNPDGTVTYTPNPGYTGTDTLTYTVKSPDGTTSVPVKVIITVTPAPVPPVAVNDSTSTPLNTPVTIPVLSNDSAKTYPIAPATVVITQQPKHGTVTVNPDGTVTYTPVNNYAGLDTLLYTVKDTTGLVSNPATVVIKTPGVAPSPVDDAGTTPVNTPVTIPVLNNDGGPLDSSTVTIVTPPTHGTVVVNPDGTVTYTPNPGYTGPDTLTYTVKSPDGTTSVPAKVVITTTPAPVPPAAVNDSTTTPVNTPVTIPVLSNDSTKTYPIAPATVVITQQPKHGTVTVNPNGTVTYTPANNYAGPDTLLYTVKDTTGLVSNPATVVIKTLGVAPSPLDDAGTTPPNISVTIPVLNNDGGPLDSSTVTIVTPPTHGTVVVNPDGTVTYTPNPGYNGPDTLTYTVKSPDGTTSVPAKVIINTTPAPVPPAAVNDSTTTPVNTPVTIPVLSNDSTKTNPIAPATVVITQQPKHGTVTVNPNGTVTYTPANNYAGPDTLLYTVKDTTGLVSNPATVIITIPGVAPVPVDDAGTTPANTPVTIPVLNNDGGPLDSSTVTIVMPPTHGTVVVNPDGTGTYTPNPGYTGPDTLTYTVKSPDGTTSIPAKVVITTTPAPVPPVAVNDSTATPENTPVTIPVLGNDSTKTNPINPATVVITQQPKHGTVTVNPNGTVTYTPTPGYDGPDDFKYTVKDNKGNTSNPATVVIKVTPVIAPPVAQKDSSATVANKPVVIPVIDNDSDSIGIDRGSIIITEQPKHGTVTVNPDGTITYTPDLGYTGSDSLKYVIKNTRGISSTPATVILTVEAEALFIPNALSPNGDGKNDKFIIRGLERYQGVTLDIYNRWGNQVYHSANYSNTWDGNGLNEGTYYYILKVKEATGEKAYKGWILLAR